MIPTPPLRIWDLDNGGGSTDVSSNWSITPVISLESVTLCQGFAGRSIRLPAVLSVAPDPSSSSPVERWRWAVTAATTILGLDDSDQQRLMTGPPPPATGHVTISADGQEIPAEVRRIGADVTVTMCVDVGVDVAILSVGSVEGLALADRTDRWWPEVLRQRGDLRDLPDPYRR